MSTRKKFSINFGWSLFEQIGSGLIGLLVSILLARILDPEDFGLLGMILIFLAISNSLVSSGLGVSLIRSKQVTDVDYSTVFYFNLLVSFLLYGVIFLLAPYISLYYNKPELLNITRVYCLIVVIRSFTVVQISRFIKENKFKQLSIIQIISLLVGGGIGITLALKGFGVWSLVFSHIIQYLTSSIFLWFVSAWKPILAFSRQAFIRHFNFGYKITISGLLDSVFKNIYNVIIGKNYSATELGYYNRADSLQSYPPNILSMALNKVTLPLFSEFQDDKIKLRGLYIKIISLALFFLTPIMVCGIVVSEELFRFLLSEKWLPAVPYFQILCLTGILLPLQTYNLNILNVMGRSDLILNLSIIKKIVFIIGVAISFQFGIIGLLWWSVINSFISFLLNSYFSGGFINYSTLMQLKDTIQIISPPLIIGVFLLYFGSSIHHLISKDFIFIVFNLILFYTIYFLYLKITNNRYLAMAIELLGIKRKN